MDKILKAQLEVGKIQKDKTNPFYKSQYFDINSVLEQLLPALEKEGITVMQPLSNVDGKPALRTIVYVDGKEVINEAILLPEK